MITVPVLALVAWLTLLRFRSRMEAVRADAVTAILDGKFTNHPVVSAYLTVGNPIIWPWSLARRSPDTQARNRRCPGRQA